MKYNLKVLWHSCENPLNYLAGQASAGIISGLWMDYWDNGTGIDDFRDRCIEEYYADRAKKWLIP